LTGKIRNRNGAAKKINNGWITAATCHPTKQTSQKNFYNTYNMP
jgi:hypothetical protein